MNEFHIIKKYLKSLTKKNDGSLSLSDDVFYDHKNKLVLSVDTYVEKIHFLDPKNPSFFLKKILRSSISDESRTSTRAGCQDTPLIKYQQ